MKNITGEIGYLKIRRCQLTLDVIDQERGNNGEFIFYEAKIVEISYIDHPEVKVEQIPAGYKDQFFYKVGDILKSKEGRVLFKTRDKISSDLQEGEMELTGLQIRNMQLLEDLEKTIKELEIKRIENDLLNLTKYTDLYKVYYGLLEGIR